MKDETSYHKVYGMCFRLIAMRAGYRLYRLTRHIDEGNRDDRAGHPEVSKDI